MRAVPMRVRTIAFLLAAAWVLLSPAYVQVFGGRGHAVRDWRMYHRRGLGICSAVFYEGQQRIDRYGLFGLQRATAPDSFRRIADEAEARSIAKQVCQKLASHDGHAADVRLTLRCGVAEGLRTLLDREENLCAD